MQQRQVELRGALETLIQDIMRQCGRCQEGFLQAFVKQTAQLATDSYCIWKMAPRCEDDAQSWNQFVHFALQGQDEQQRSKTTYLRLLQHCNLISKASKSVGDDNRGWIRIDGQLVVFEKRLLGPVCLVFRWR